MQLHNVKIHYHKYFKRRSVHSTPCRSTGPMHGVGICVSQAAICSAVCLKLLVSPLPSAGRSHPRHGSWPPHDKSLFRATGVLDLVRLLGFYVSSWCNMGSYCNLHYPEG